MVVVDTNVLTYLLLAGDRTAQAQALFARDPDWRSESFLLIEFSNVITTYRRHEALTRVQAEQLLESAESLMRGLVTLPHCVALRAAQRFGVSAYDARFLAIAEHLRAKLVTEDARLRSAAPGLTESLSDAASRR